MAHSTSPHARSVVNSLLHSISQLSIRALLCALFWRAQYKCMERNNDCRYYPMHKLPEDGTWRLLPPPFQSDAQLGSWWTNAILPYHTLHTQPHISPKHTLHQRWERCVYLCFQPPIICEGSEPSIHPVNHLSRQNFIFKQNAISTIQSRFYTGPVSKWDANLDKTGKITWVGIY